MSRSLTSFSLSLVAFFTTVAVGTANAKECKTDSDCASGFECVLGKIGGTSSGTGGSPGSSGGAGVGAGAAVGTACAGPDCPVSSPAVPPSVPRLVPVPVDGGAAPQPVTRDGGTAVVQYDGLPSRVGDAGAIGVPTPVGDPMPVVTTGFCRVKVLVCTSKADCPANLDCVKETAMVKRPACAPNTTCDTSLPVSETGTCKAVCNVDSDCPAPLVCKLQGQVCSGGGSVSSDGTVTTIPETCSGGNKICSYQAVTCSTDAECTAPNYQCAKVSEYQSCTGTATPSCPKSVSDAGVTCTPTPAEPPVCTSTVVNNCLPKEIKCGAGQACPSGWSCFDFTNFDSASIPGWSTPMPSQACLPDGLILTIKGQANGGSGATYSGTNPTRGGTSGAGETGGTGTIDLGSKGGNPSVPVTNTGDPIPPQVTPVPSSDGQEHAVNSDAGTEAAATKVRGGGCSMGGVQDSSFGLGLTLALAGLVLRVTRRRR